MFRSRIAYRFEYEENEVKIYSLTKPLKYKSLRYDYTVPTGFKTDFASVPKILHFAFKPRGKWSRASILHDFLYSDECRYVSRFKADLVFLEAMKSDKVNKWTRYTFFLGVRIFGGFFKR